MNIITVTGNPHDEETAIWKKAFLHKFSEICGDNIAMCYKTFSQVCLETYGLNHDAYIAAIDQAWYYKED